MVSLGDGVSARKRAERSADELITDFVKAISGSKVQALVVHSPKNQNHNLHWLVAHV